MRIIQCIFILLFCSFNLMSQENGMRHQDDLNFAEFEMNMEQTQIAQSFDNNPPHPVMIWLTRVGLPVLCLYVDMKEWVVAHWQKLITIFKSSHVVHCDDKRQFS